MNTSKKSSTKQSGSTHKNSNVTFSNNKAQNVASEINVIGLTVDQALPIVDKYLDDCYIANLENARIVHGKGTGRLRDGIHSFLKTQKGLIPIISPLKSKTCIYSALSFCLRD